MQSLYSLARHRFPKPLKGLLKRLGGKRLTRRLNPINDPDYAWPLSGALDGHRLRIGRPGNQGLATQPYEPDVCAVIEHIVQPGWICADVGAHIGLITLLLARLVGPAGRVVAFEAFPENARLLHENAVLNGYAARVHVECVAVSDGTRDRLWLFPGRWRSSAEWNIVGHDVEGNKTDPQLEIPATSLDAYFPPGSRLDFVKMDIEGAEAQALAGMRRLLRQVRPVVLVEFHDEIGWAGRKELFAAGYQLYDLNGRLLDPVLDTQRVYHCLARPTAWEVMR